ncbi:aminotransferase class V-fold PLP-dependent enzyme [Lutimonas vermicola]|uniref:Aminotransferase class V-fold PLP-dependent enzyme n=1 Tax=Lutimonas vermicola TaxID=414288 RepID=A0ABU9KX39_9FLAO
MDKRAFLKQLSLLGVGTSLSLMEGLAKNFDAVSHITPVELASNENFWESIRKGYLLNKDYINLENGYYCMMPQESFNDYLENVRTVNFLASRYMRTVQPDNQNTARQQLADLAGCSFDEVVITRNTTESLDLVIAGRDWKKGDEAIFAEQDYGAMMDMFRLMEERHGIVSKVVSIPNHPKNDKEIVELYANQITHKTKMLMVSHVVNITGQVLPVKKICDMAHKKGVEVMVDGAHAFAHLDFKIPDLNCDYYGTSLHKWLSVPLGAGLLYVKKDKIKNLWPLFAETALPRDDIDRLNHRGTTPVHVELAIPKAIDIYKMIGGERKEKRLKYLKEYWTAKVKSIPGIIINTPFEPQRSCAIANVGIKDMHSKEMANTLFEVYNIWVVAIDRPGVHGCRITPNVFTSTDELDIFVKALTEMAG